MIQANASSSNGIASLSTVWAVMEAARSGAADATAAARGFLPAAVSLVSGGVYATGYAIGFAASFPAVFVSRIVPGNNPIVYGLADGGRAGFDLARSTLAPAPAGDVPRLAAVEA